MPRTSSISSTPGSTSGNRTVIGMVSLPPPPPPLSPRGGRVSSGGNISSSIHSSYSQSIAKSMTIDEMRQLHQRALSEAEAKRTELRLVLASRYRELVGSSDEVIRMKERAQELHDLVKALPTLMEKLADPSKINFALKGQDDEGKESSEEEKKHDDGRHQLAMLKRKLSSLPRTIHRSLDANNVHQATTRLIELFTLIAKHTNEYPLANCLSKKDPSSGDSVLHKDSHLVAQMRMVFLQVQTLPKRIRRIAMRNLLRPASYGRECTNPTLGAARSAAALASLNLLRIQKDSALDSATESLDMYFESKAKILVTLLDKLTPPTSEDGEPISGTGHAEGILSKIVLILQYDVILHPYQFFCLRKFPTKEGEDIDYGDSFDATCENIVSTLPLYDVAQVKHKCSKFLAAHLPLIRTKVRSVLVTIAGTTASALGKIRQSLYDKTDGVESTERLDSNGVCTWEDAVNVVVDVGTVLNQVDVGGDANQRRFSLWSTLFSNTFSSLVHSLLTTAFQSVHSQLVSTLQASLDNAPPLTKILPHEAYRNTLSIATELDRALLKVSEDAHELLVHAEERIESERRLRQSLYVQTCEIMGRLVCELRRIVHRENDDASDATKELIVGRLCFLLKFRLTSLPKLLDPEASQAAQTGTSGMISFVDLQSAFELADHNEDGLITFEEAMEAVESAFSGTQFRGTEMLRETLLLSASDTDGSSTTAAPMSGNYGTPVVWTNLTLNELTLLAARGLRHENSGHASALGALQKSLDDIVDGCFKKWASAVMSNSNTVFNKNISDFLETACTVPDAEWQRIYPSENSFNSFAQTTDATSALTLRNVSPYVVAFMLDLASVLNRTTCPSDTLPPIPSPEYASSLGILPTDSGVIPTFVDTVRWALFQESLESVSAALQKGNDQIDSNGMSLEKSGASALLQHRTDVSFLKSCFFERNRLGFNAKGTVLGATAKTLLDGIVEVTENLLSKHCDRHTLNEFYMETVKKHKYIFQACDLSFSSLLGPDAVTSVSVAGELDLGAGSSSSTPLFREPLTSTRRFALLPVQADRTLSEIQLRGKYEKKESAASRPDLASNVVSSGFGFLSSMLKKS